VVQEGLGQLVMSNIIEKEEILRSVQDQFKEIDASRQSGLVYMILEDARGEQALEKNAILPNNQMCKDHILELKPLNDNKEASLTMFFDLDSESPMMPYGIEINE